MIRSSPKTTMKRGERSVREKKSGKKKKKPCRFFGGIKLLEGSNRRTPERPLKKPRKAKRRQHRPRNPEKKEKGSSKKKIGGRGFPQELSWDP